MSPCWSYKVLAATIPVACRKEITAAVTGQGEKGKTAGRLGGSRPRSEKVGKRVPRLVDVWLAAAERQAVHSLPVQQNKVAISCS